MYSDDDTSYRFGCTSSRKDDTNGSNDTHDRKFTEAAKFVGFEAAEDEAINNCCSDSNLSLAVCLLVSRNPLLVSL